MAEARDAEIRELKAQVAMLTDLVVSAAALYFEQIGSASERDYLSEALYTHATALVEANPRLAGAFPR
jgi:hypothetical protein